MAGAASGVGAAAAAGFGAGAGAGLVVDVGGGGGAGGVGVVSGLSLGREPNKPRRSSCIFSTTDMSLVESD